MISAISAAVSKSRIVILEGPAGAGKSIALASWAETWTGPGFGVWVTMDDSMSKRLGFWRRIFSEFVKAMGAEFTDLDGVSLNEENVSQAPFILADALNNFGSEIILVLDDGEYAQVEEIPSDLVRLIEHTKNFRILSSATSLRGGTRRLVLSADSTLINTKKLVLKHDEVSELLRENVGKIAEQFTGLIMDLGGNLVGIMRTVIQELNISEPELWDSRIRELILSHFELSVLDQIKDPELHRFIIETSLIGEDELTPELATKIVNSDLQTAALSIGKINNLGLGTWKPNLVTQPFRYYSVLIKQLAQEHNRISDSRKKEIHGILAEWQLDKGLPYEAFKHAARAVNIPLIREIVIKHFLSFSPKINADIIRAFDTIDAKLIESDVLLLFFRALIRTRRVETYNAGRRDFLAATTLIQQELEDASGMLGLFYEVIIQVTYRMTGQWDALEARLVKLDTILSELETKPLLNWEQETLEKARQTLAVNYLSFHDFPNAIRQAQLTLQWLDETRDTDEIHGSARSIIAYCHLMLGDVALAEKEIERARKQVTPFGWKESAYGNYYQLTEALLEMEQGNFDNVEERMKLLEAQKPMLVNWNTFLRVKALHITLTRGGQYANGFLVDEISRFEGTIPWPNQLNQALLADWCMILISCDLVNLGKDRISQLDSSNLQAATALAQLDVFLGKFDEGASQALMMALNEDVPIRLRVQNGLTAALAMWSKGEKDLAVDFYHTTTAAAMQHRIVIPYRFLPEQMSAEIYKKWMSKYQISFTPEEQKIAELWEKGVSASPHRVVVLTKREKDVLSCLYRDLTLDQIAKELYISANTVKTLRSSLYKKLGVNNKKDALQAVFEQGLI